MIPTRSTQLASSSLQTREIADYLPLVNQVVAGLMRHLPRNVQRDDLIGAGSYGLFDALRKSPDRGPAFEWYARVRIRGAVMDELRSQDWLTRRARAVATKARAEGQSAGPAVVNFDDLLETQTNGLADGTFPAPDAPFQRRTERAELERAVSRLPQREADIVSSHYFGDVPFCVIAARLGVTSSRVSQLHSRAIGTLRGQLAKEPCLQPDAA